MNSPEPSIPKPVEHRQLRASDADRDQIAALLREALAEGRLTPEEHAERIEAVFAARTYAELDTLIEDLPGEHRLDQEPTQAQQRVRLAKEAPLPRPREEPASVHAILSAASRSGRWLVEAESSVSCILGSVELDFRQAVLTKREVIVNITCVLGQVEILVPPGVLVTNSITAILGSNQTGRQDAATADAPVIRLSGVNLLGSVEVEYKPQ